MPAEPETVQIIPWVLATLGALGTAAGTTIAYLFRKNEYDNAQAITRLEGANNILTIKSDKCEADRTVLFAKCERNAERIEWLERRLQQIDAAAPKSHEH